MKRTQLEDLFCRFAVERLRAEVIDSLPLAPEGKNQPPKADFLFDQRRVVCELKSTVVDTEQKIGPFIQQLRKTHPHFPRDAKGLTLVELFQRLPDGEAVAERLMAMLARPIEDALSSANRQIRSTKETLNLEQSGGVLVLLVSGLLVLPPPVVAKRFHRLLQKRTANGSHRYPHVNAIYMISESHAAALSDGSLARAHAIIDNDFIPDPGGAVAFAEMLARTFPRFLGSKNVVAMDLESVDRLRFTPDNN